ncbi:Alpha/Beta hydrolase protein [Hyaloraphidium curvatum]|nr:Alpha/Beta hydrolase protein [Hyaloraphidium curvatum]
MGDKSEAERAAEAREEKAIAIYLRLRALAPTYPVVSPSDASDAEPERDAALKLPYGSESRLQFLHLRFPANWIPGKKVPVVVAIHGGFWKRRYGIGYFEPLAARLAEQLGAATANLEYRRVPSAELPTSGGSDEYCEDESLDGEHDRGGFPRTIDDVCQAIGFVASELAPRYGLDPDRIVVLGHSAGGHLAGLVAGIASAGSADAEPVRSWVKLLHGAKIRGAVVLAGVMDLVEASKRGVGKGAIAGLMGAAPGDAPEEYRAASPSTYLPAVLRSTRVHLVQGTEDDDVPADNADEFAGRASQVDPAAVREGRFAITRLDGRGHFEMVDPQEGAEAWTAVVEACRSVLG